MIDATSISEQPTQAHGLSRRLGLPTATAVVVAEVIGVGIFLTAAEMVKSLGSPFWLLLVWLSTGLAATGGALCFGALAARWPKAGGPYVYLKEVYGPRMGFLFGWLSMLVTDPGITAALAVGVARYVAYLVPLSRGAAGCVAVGSIGLLALVNIRGVGFSSRVVRWLAALKLGVLGFLVLWGFGLGQGNWSNFLPLVEQRPGSAPLAGALMGGMIAAFFSLGGWWDVSKLAGEVRDPERTLPRALLLGVLLVTTTYLFVCLVFLYLVPGGTIDSREVFAGLAGEALFGRSGGVVLALIVIVTVLGSLAAVLMVMPRVYLAMAQDGLFFEAVAAIHPRYQTPARAILIQAVLAGLLAVTGSFEEILSYFIVPTVIFLALAVATVFVIRNQTRPGEEPIAIPWFPIPPLIFLAQIVILVALLVIDKPGHSAAGLGVVLLGLPVYHLVFARQSRLGSSGKASIPDKPATAGVEIT